ncbi:MAG: flagellar basal body-associated FliL family protein [Bacillota bacterium]
MSRGLLIALIGSVLVLTLGVAGIAGYVFFLMPKGNEAAVAAPETKKEEEGHSLESHFHKMNHFVTNLADTDRLRYIDVTIALGVKSEESEKKLKEAEPQVRDLILSQIRSLTSADLAGPQGKAKLAEVLEKALAESFKDHVTKVYVTDMVVQ